MCSQDDAVPWLPVGLDELTAVGIYLIATLRILEVASLAYGTNKLISPLDSLDGIVECAAFPRASRQLVHLCRSRRSDCTFSGIIQTNSVYVNITQWFRFLEDTYLKVNEKLSSGKEKRVGGADCNIGLKNYDYQSHY
ncbi:hypothetical protein FGSG_13819 [Fusarium graminearum PH-1]|uniref:Chromosome 1, complete genome n=1 Tax=Gibberella zeae (strain ATCC MYA-4620 / CBS 123657 / FGSC 9075 / NRRL 31084 / PH-1) TaxID=229533 RepID=I1SAD8_GIBZE|nr:hypothetical protein FGSG_13819 [Fusarium graminearum PH-1]ESU17467.1 hypothetical protein FGSG_13819 [Fusarium graminearum PH-1]CEF76186.1 unnamed protein product [Fusarium graminearum]|eukprot:XP_011319729.1 hypothetical protein FGSG_13819 [Fusarium graminearum PH-1]